MSLIVIHSMNLTAQGITINQSVKIVKTVVHPGVSVKMITLIVHQGLREFNPDPGS